VFYEGDKVQDSIRFASDCPFCFSCSTGPVIKTNLSVIAEAQSIHINQDYTSYVRTGTTYETPDHSLRNEKKKERLCKLGWVCKVF